MKNRFITRFQKTTSKGQIFNPLCDLMDDEGYLPFNMRLSKIEVSTALSKAFNTGLNQGYKTYLQNLDNIESNPDVIEELSIARYDDLQLQKAYVRGFEQARQYLQPINHDSDLSETLNTSNDGVNTDGNTSTTTGQTGEQ